MINSGLVLGRCPGCARGASCPRGILWDEHQLRPEHLRPQHRQLLHGAEPEQKTSHKCTAHRWTRVGFANSECEFQRPSTAPGCLPQPEDNGQSSPALQVPARSPSLCSQIKCPEERSCRRSAAEKIPQKEWFEVRNHPQLWVWATQSPFPFTAPFP